MRRLGALLALLLPLVAAAEWRSLGAFGGTPQDVQVVDGGLVVVVSNGAVTLWRFDDTTTSLVETVPGAFIGGGVLASGCPFGVTAAGVVSGGAACPGPQSLGSSNWVKARVLSPDGTGVGLTNNGANTDTLQTGLVFDGGVWTSRGTNTSASLRSLHTVTLGDAHYAVISGGTFSNTLRVSVDGGPLASIPVSTAGTFREPVPFARLGRIAILGFNGTQLRLVPDVDQATVTQIAMPGGLTPSFIAASGNIGLVTALGGTLTAAVPNPAEPHTSWVVRTDFPGTGAWRVHCAGGRTCAVTTDAGVAWLYENATAPELFVSGLGLVDAGATIRLAADAGDADQDPLFISWAADGGSFTAASSDGRSVDLVIAPGACSGSVVATVTDGWPAFDRTVTLPFTVVDRGALFVDAGALSVAAGDAPVVFSAELDGGCQPPSSLAWSTSDGQSGSGPLFSYVVPTTACSATGLQVTVTSTATWPLGAPVTTTQDTTLTVAPWGAPNTPQFSSPVTQPAGTTQVYVPSDVEHACSTTMGFPGTALTWTFSGAGVTATPVDGGLSVTAPATCVPLQLVASAVREVVGDTTGRRSDAGVLVIDVPARIDPLDGTTPFSLSAGGDGGVLVGTVDAGVSCLAQRVVSAEIVVSQGGARVASTSTSVPGEWSLSVPGSCSGGRYDVEARLLEDGGFTGASATTEVTLPQLAVAVGPLNLGRIDAQCGAGAAAPVALEPVPGTCAAAEYTWRALTGPALETSTGTGASLTVQTMSRDFASVGQPIILEFAADAGFGNFELATRTIEIGVQPFLEVSWKASPPLRREEEPVTFEITLRNPTACDVSGLAVTLPVSNATPLMDGVLVDGARTAAESTGDGVFLRDVAVPASGETRIQLSVRPRLLGAATIAPLVSLQGYVVSLAPGDAAPAIGCGCASVPPTAVIVLALGLLVLRRRRRGSR